MATDLKFAHNEHVAIKPTKNMKAFFDPGTLPWLDWVLPGVQFKLLQVNALTGGFTVLLKSEPDNQTAIHGHSGAIEGIILEGGISYHDDGSVGGVVDAKFMWDLAEAGGAAEHLIKPPTWLE